MQRIAERAETSTRTVYRVLNPKPHPDGRPVTLKLDLADRLVCASGRTLAEIGCRVIVEGVVLDYGDA